MKSFTLHSTFFMPASVPDQFNEFFVDGNAINRTDDPRFTGTPQEWEVCSLYSALKMLEYKGYDYSSLRGEIIERILARSKECGGFWIHNQFTKGSNESHMRYTSAILRLLVDAYIEGIIKDKKQIIEYLYKHISFVDRLENDALWFLHDSNELVENKFYNKSFISRPWGAKKNNQFVLNTHVDTLVTLAYFRYYFENLSSEQIHKIDSNLAAGLKTLAYILEWRNLFFTKFVFQFIDKIARYFHYRKYNAYNYRFRHRRKTKQKSNLDKIFRLMNPLHIYFSYIRTPFRAITRTFIHYDGFTERDLFIKGRPAYYHLSNIWDFAKLLNMLKRNNWHCSNNVENGIIKVLEKGIRYSLWSKYSDFILDSFNHYGIAVMLAETFLIMFQLDNKYIVKYMINYIQIRKKIPPSPAMRGYDPVIFNNKQNKKFLIEINKYLNCDLCDIVMINSNAYLLINAGDTEYKITFNKFSFCKFDQVYKHSFHLNNNELTIFPNTAVMISCFLDDNS